MDEVQMLILSFGVSGLLGIGVCTLIGNALVAKARAAHGLRPRAQLPPDISRRTWDSARSVVCLFGLLWGATVWLYFRRWDLAAVGLLGFVFGTLLRVHTQDHNPDERDDHVSF